MLGFIYVNFHFLKLKVLDYLVSNICSFFFPSLLHSTFYWLADFPFNFLLASILPLYVCCLPPFWKNVCCRGFDDEMRAVVARNLEGRGIKLHPGKNLAQVFPFGNLQLMFILIKYLFKMYKFFSSLFLGGLSDCYTFLFSSWSKQTMELKL